MEDPMDYVGEAGNSDADACYGDNVTYGVLCTLIREPVVPLCVLGKIAQLNSYYSALVLPRINRARVLRAKYLKRFCRALWRKYTYYPLSVPEKRTQTIDLGSARANEFGIMLDHASMYGKLMFVTGISFICRDKIDFTFTLGVAIDCMITFKVSGDDFTRVPKSLQPPQGLDPSRKTVPGAFVAHVDMRACPFDVGVADSTKPWVYVGPGHEFMREMDPNFVKLFFTHIIVNYEIPNASVPQTPFVIYGRGDLVAKIDAGSSLRYMAHSLQQQRSFADDGGDSIQKITRCKQLIATYRSRFFKNNQSQ